MAFGSFGGVVMSATTGLMRGERTPIPARRPAWVLNPPFWKIVTALLSRGAIRPSGLAVGRPGIVGTKAGDVPGYDFSPALKASGLTWDEATLDKWLENPMKLVPGTRMTYAGQSDPAKRKDLIAYLKTLK